MRAANMGSPNTVLQLFGERRSSEMSELSAWAGSEGYGACDDADELNIAVTKVEEE